MASTRANGLARKVAEPQRAAASRENGRYLDLWEDTSADERCASEHVRRASEKAEADNGEDRRRRKLQEGKMRMGWPRRDRAAAAPELPATAAWRQGLIRAGRELTPGMPCRHKAEGRQSARQRAPRKHTCRQSDRPGEHVTATTATSRHEARAAVRRMAYGVGCSCGPSGASAPGSASRGASVMPS